MTTKEMPFGRSSSLPSSPTEIGDERGSTDLLCTRHPPLASSPGEGIVQDGRVHVQDLQ